MTIKLLLLLFGALQSKALDNYDHHQHIVPDAYTLHWKLAGDNIHLAIEANTTGWVAFGLADPTSGTMDGADIVHAHVSDQGEVVVRDTYAMDKTTPKDDTCQDWKGVKGSTSDGRIVVELMRKLDTGDSQDRVFASDPDKPDAIIVAWGTSPTFGYHQANRFATRLNFNEPNQKDPLAALKADSSVMVVDVRITHIVTEDVTKYIDEFAPANPNPIEATTCASFNGACAEGQNRRLDSDVCESEECVANDCCLPEGIAVCAASDRQCKEVPANGLVFQCYETGPENGIPVMFLHGFPEWNKYWFTLQDYWAKERPNTFRAVACSLRGYSPKAAPDDLADYAYDNFVADVWALADAVGFDRFHLVGHDHGAGLAWKVAAGSNHTRLLSLTNQAVYHPDAFNEAILNDERQMVASNYFNQFAMDNNAEAVSILVGGLSPDALQKLLWWYNSSVPSLVARPEIPSESILTKYPEITLPAMIQQLLPLPERAAIPPPEPFGAIKVPTFMVCGANDPYLLCESPTALKTEEYIENFYQYGSYKCGHNLFGECEAGEGQRVMEAMTAFLLNFSDTENTGARERADGRRLTVDEACPVYSAWKKTACAEEPCSFDGLEEGPKFVLCDEINSNKDCLAEMDSRARYAELCTDVNPGKSFFIDLPDSGKEYHIVGLEHLITPGLERTVHHMTLNGYSTIDGGSDDAFLWGWAIGASALVHPEECGVRVGGSTGITAIKINFHYDNPLGDKTGKLDTSGIRFYLTENLRPHDCGVMSLGDPHIQLMSQPIPDGYSTTEFQCPGECTRDLVPNGATVFGHFLHMHQNGKQIWTELHRDGKLVKQIARNDFWDHNFQSTTPVSYTVEAGDEFRTTCVHFAHEGEDLIWGLASDDEMCIDFVYYWPKIPGKSTECGYKRCGSMTDTVVIDEGSVEYSFGASSKCTDKPVSDKPVTDKPVSDKPVTDKPVSDKPVTDKPVTDFRDDQSGAPSSFSVSVPLALLLLASAVGF